MLYRALVLALATSTHAWNDCAFPDVGYYVVDEGEPPPPPHLHHHPTTTTAISNSPPPQPPTTSTTTTTTTPPPHRRHRHLLRVRRGGDERNCVHRRLMKGHFALVGVTDNGDVQPEPAATLWGDTASEVQVARTSLNPL